MVFLGDAAERVSEPDWFMPLGVPSRRFYSASHDTSALSSPFGPSLPPKRPDYSCVGAVSGYTRIVTRGRSPTGREMGGPLVAELLLSWSEGCRTSTTGRSQCQMLVIA